MAGVGEQLAKVDGAGVGIHMFGGVKLAPMWPAQYWDCSWLPHVGCSVYFVIVFLFLLNFWYSQLLGELGSLVAPTWDAQNLCNCICILYLVLALNFCILNLVFGEGGLFSRLPRGMLRLFVRGQCSEAACCTMESIDLS